MESKEGDGDGDLLAVDPALPAEGRADAGKEHWEAASDVSSEAGSEDEKIVRPRDKPEDKHFTFYNFGYHLIPFHDILDSFYSMRKAFYRRQDKQRRDHVEDSLESELSAKPSKSRRAFDIKEFQKTRELENQSTKQHKISRFHPVEPKWDGTMVLDNALLESLYRIPQSDSSGKVIFSVVRDEAQDATPWRHCLRGRDLPASTLDKCNPRLQLQILAHMNETVTKVEEEYDKMPCRTQAENELKARMGADLNCLQKQRKQLLRLVKKEKKKVGLKPSVSGREVLFGGV